MKSRFRPIPPELDMIKKDSDRYYYADLNPDYGAWKEPRWRVFIHTGPGQSSMTQLRYVTRKAA